MQNGFTKSKEVPEGLRMKENILPGGRRQDTTLAVPVDEIDET